MSVRIVFYVVALAVVTALIWRWNRGAQVRRFRQAYPAPNPAWGEADADFLGTFEAAFALRRGMARNLPPEATPMDVYLVLYPEHCIYDDSELTRLLGALRRRFGEAVGEEALARPLGELARQWRAAPEGKRA